MADEPDDKAWVPWALSGCGCGLLVGICSIAGIAFMLADSRPPRAQAGPGPETSGDVRMVTATVEQVTGSRPVPIGSVCEFAVEKHAQQSGGYWCRSQIACNGRLLYGGPSSGYFPCTMFDPPRTDVVGQDPQTTSQDTDASMELDTLQGLLTIRDDVRGPYGAYQLTARVSQVR